MHSPWRQEVLHPSSFEVLSTGVKVALFATDGGDLMVDAVVVEVDALVPVVVEGDALLMCYMLGMEWVLQ